MPASYELGGMEKFVTELVAGGRYNSKSEVVRDALRLLEAKEQERIIQLDELRAAFRDGIESGNYSDANTVLDRLEMKYQALCDQSG